MIPTCPICNKQHPMAAMAAYVHCGCGHRFDVGDFDPVAERAKRGEDEANDDTNSTERDQ